MLMDILCFGALIIKASKTIQAKALLFINTDIEDALRGKGIGSGGGIWQG